jgi:uncharacterized membrane protein
MKARTSLKTILIFSLAGMLFSGYLSYTELFAKYCAIGDSCTSVSGVPACVYGFIMYLIVFIISIIGLNSSN